MKIAEVDWPLFWPALNQQDSASRNRWLGRWVFADEGVRLSLQPAPRETTSSNPADAYNAAERTPWTEQAPAGAARVEAPWNFNESIVVGAPAPSRTSFVR